MPGELLLASASPRRAALLRQAGIPFRALPTGADESLPPGLGASSGAAILARRKAFAARAAAEGDGNGWVLGADTLGEREGRVLGKPASPGDAARMLASLAGKRHTVHTGVCVLRVADGAVFEGVERTEVELAPLPAETIEAYVATGESLGKAGAYAIQGMAAAFVRDLRGCYTNVVGLPLHRTTLLLRQAGFPLPPALVLDG